MLMDLLLDRKEKMGVKITENILTAASWNTGDAGKIMELLSDRCAPDIQITS